MKTCYLQQREYCPFHIYGCNCPDLLFSPGSNKADSSLRNIGEWELVLMLGNGKWLQHPQISMEKLVVGCVSEMKERVPHGGGCQNMSLTQEIYRQKHCSSYLE